MDQSEKRTLGNYCLERLLGQGGFAEVYLGEHIYLKTPAAIKVLHIAVSTEALANFLLEARTIAHLEHPHIVRVLEFGMEGRAPYLVMNYAPHGSLRQRHQRGSRLDPSTMIRYMKQVASALQYAHDQLLVHRDVKPENVLLGAKDELMLSDFGLAIVSQNGHQWQRRKEAGTIRYTAPEQLAGHPCFASDQYSLGIMAYEWLCGEVPFLGPDIIMQHIQTLPPALSEKVSGLPPEVERVVMRALAKDPEARFPRITDFAEAFEQALTLHAPGELVAVLQVPQDEVRQDTTQPEAKRQAAAPLEHPQTLRQPQEEPVTSGTQKTSDQRESSSQDGVARPAPEQTPDYDLPPLYSLDIFPTQPALRAERWQLRQTPLPALIEDFSRPTLQKARRTTRRVGLPAIFCTLLLGALVLAYMNMPGKPVPSSPQASGTSKAFSTQAAIQTHRSPATPVTSKTAIPVVGPSPSAPPATSPTASAILTVTITAIPDKLSNKDSLRAQVHTNIPGVSVKLSMTNSETGDIAESAPQITDRQGNATITLNIHVPGSPHAQGVGTVVAIANSQSGLRAVSQAKQVQLG